MLGVFLFFREGIFGVEFNGGFVGIYLPLKKWLGFCLGGLSCGDCTM